VARNACGLALLAVLALTGCPNFSFPNFSSKKEEQEGKAAEAKLAVIRARTDSLRKARHLADSLAQARQAACVDSVRFELGRVAAFTPKTKSRKKKQKNAPPSAEMILTQAQSACGQDATAPQATIAAGQPVATDSAKGTAPTMTMATPASRPQPDVMLASNDSIRWADSVQKAKEIEMSRETFSYGGAARDPFNSLFNMAKNGPELADLQLVGIYQNLRTPTSSVAVFREKAGGKRHKLRSGDQVGRSRLVQIRDREVVFVIEDFGFERQETLSLRKQEDVIQ
jgi:hypothetical protein